VPTTLATTTPPPDPSCEVITKPLIMTFRSGLLRCSTALSLLTSSYLTKQCNKAKNCVACCRRFGKKSSVESAVIDECKQLSYGVLMKLAVCCTTPGMCLLVTNAKLWH
jgi:hypothetical protein